MNEKNEAEIKEIAKELQQHNREIGAGARSQEKLRSDAEYVCMHRHGISPETLCMMLTDAMFHAKHNIALLDAAKHALQTLTGIDVQYGNLRSRCEKLQSELLDQTAFNEGLEEHISDLLGAMQPFAELMQDTSGRIPTERLSFANWHALSKAYEAARSAMSAMAIKVTA